MSIPVAQQSWSFDQPSNNAIMSTAAVTNTKTPAQRLRELTAAMNEVKVTVERKAQEISPDRDIFFSHWLQNNLMDGPGMPKKTAQASGENDNPKKQKTDDISGSNNLTNGEDTIEVEQAEEEPYHDDYNLLDPSSVAAPDDFSVRKVVDDVKKLYESEILPKHRVPAQYDVSAVKDDFKVKPHQLRAAACVDRARTSQHKGLLIGDAMGNGKTIETLVPLVHLRLDARKLGKSLSPDIIVAPPSLTRQWESEIHKFFGDTFSTLVVQNSALPPSMLYKYDFVVVSYPHVTTERGRMRGYLREVQRYCAGKTTSPPMRPRLPLLAELHVWGRGWGEYLIFDEAHVIKNTESATFKAAFFLRSRVETCIMLSATPLDNVWSDVFAYIRMLKGHLIKDYNRFISVFTGARYVPRLKTKPPTNYHLRRLIMFMESFTLARSPLVSAAPRPTPIMSLVQFEVDQSTRDRSNEEFERWKSTAGADEHTAFSGLVLATQIVMHPELSQILSLYRRDVDGSGQAKPLTNEEQEELKHWETRIQENDRHRSPRIDKIEWLINSIYEKHPEDKVIIMDESKYFLKIVKALLAVMDFPPPFTVYDGDSVPEERAKKLAAFKASKGFQILLMTRGTGGLGLNLQEANHIIVTGQWWKDAAIWQAIGRLWREGQMKQVHCYILEALGCKIETYKQQVRGEKAKVIKSIMDKIVRDTEPGPEPPKRNIEYTRRAKK